MNAAAAGGDGTGEPGKIFGRVEAPLIREAQRHTSIEVRHGRPVRPLNFNANLTAGLIFLLQVRLVAFLGRIEIAVHPHEIAIYAFVTDDCFDPVHGRDLTVIIEARFILATHLDQLGIEIVEFGGEMGGRPGSHAVADLAHIDNDDGAAEAGKLIGR
jgi:hypothetical protein